MKVTHPWRQTTKSSSSSLLNQMLLKRVFGTTRNRAPSDFARQQVGAFLKSAFATLVVANANGFVYFRQENFSVADFPGSRRPKNRLHGFFHHSVA